jgi:Cu+-exporting ATPase
MHREISHSDANFAAESPLPLYAFTGLLAVLLGLDLYPKLATLLGWAAPWASDALGSRFALIAAVVGGARILYGSLQSLLDGKLGADLALAVACLAAILMNEPLVAAEVVFIGMVGECLEAFTFARTQSAIRRIVEVFPIRCWLLKDGQEVRVFTNELKVGDRVVVKPGGKIPVDGVVTDGRSAVDVSPLTGESVPLDKGPGDEVLAGSLNQFGALTIDATKVAEQTVAGKVVELTARALKDKTSGERIADRMARFFLPMVLGVALITFLGFFVFHSRLRTPPLTLRPALIAAMYPTLAVLVVACPCALILATPAAIMAALARLAGTGILIKSGRAIEQLAQVTALAIDKTGTLTEGKLAVRGFHTLAGTGADELLRLAASAEQPSEHPLGRAVVDEAKRRGIPLDGVAQFQAFPGAGIVTGLSQATIIVGTQRLLEERGVAWPAEASALAGAIDAAGETPLWVASNGQLLGAVGVHDHPRPEAAGVLADFRAMGIAPIVLLTGDRGAAARAVGGDLGFTDIAAELLPHQKAERIDALKQSGAAVAMIGDGINDAPALARANVGLAVSGVDLAAEAGDIVLLGDPLRPLPLLFRLSRQTVRDIRQNILWFAFGVNILGILLTSWLWPLFAPAGWVEQSPLAAVIYHQLGSLAVLLNSMRLLWFERSAANSAFARWNGSLRNVDLWLEHTFDLHEWSHGLGEHRKKVAFGLTTFLLLAYILSGLTIVRPDETAVVRRFGRPVATLDPGWHLRFPWPIEDALRVSERIRTIEVGFRENPDISAASWTWTSAHRKDNRRQEEATMITGDGNLVDIQAVLRYRVTNPSVYLFEVAGAEEVLRGSLESALRGLVAGKPFHELLTVEREAFQTEVLARLRRTCASYGSEHGMGIDLEGLSLIDLHPPAEVVAAYYAVAEAMEERDRRINKAQELATAQRKAALADSDRIIARANAAAAEKTLAAAGETLRFLDRSAARRGLSEQQEMLLTLDAIELLLRGVPSDAADKQIAGRRRQTIAAQIALSDFRTFWDTVGNALAGRSMILVDSDKVPGHRNLFLVDPDLLRPSIIMPSRMPPTRPEEP